MKNARDNIIYVSWSGNTVINSSYRQMSGGNFLGGELTINCYKCKSWDQTNKVYNGPRLYMQVSKINDTHCIPQVFLVCI